MSEVLLDNSFLWGYRKPNSSEENTKFLEKLLQDFSLNLENVFLTERSFIEVIGKGKISSEIGIPDLLKKEREEIQECLRKNQAINEIKVRAFIDDLENAIYKKLESGLSPEIILQTTKDNLEFYPFAELLKPVEFKIIKYAQALQKVNNYKEFIKALCEDSTIRFVLNIVNLEGISPKDIQQAIKCIDNILKIIILKYRNSEILKSNLILMMAGLKKHAEAELKRGQPGKKPLIRVFDDRADGELGYYSLVGRSINPVTVILSEKQKIVEERLIYNFKGMGEVGNYHPLKAIFGRIINVDFETLSYKETLTDKFIHEKFRDACGNRLVFQKLELTF